MGVSDSTAKDYIRTVIIQAQKIYSKWYLILLTHNSSLFVLILSNPKQGNFINNLLGE
jgi:hypothetical protein